MAAQKNAGAGRIDVHFHIIPQFYQDEVRSAGVGPARRNGYPDYSPKLALEVMDANNISFAVTSVGQPGVQFADPTRSRLLARKLNEYSSELMAQWPTRFGSFALLPIHDIADAVAEAEYALDVLKHQGVCLFSNYGGKYLGDPFFEPLLFSLNERKAVVFVHPTLHSTSRNLGLDIPIFILEYPFDTTRAAMNLVFSGALDRYPNIKFILAHAGGTLPYLATRLSVSPEIDPSMPPWPRERFQNYLKSFWYDNALSYGATSMSALKTIADPKKILFGSDWPFVPPSLVADEVMIHEEAGLHTADEIAAIDHLNALTLLPYLPAL